MVYETLPYFFPKGEGYVGEGGGQLFNLSILHSVYNDILLFCFINFVTI